MAAPRLVATVILLVLFWDTNQADAQALDVTITVTRTDPPDFTPENDNDYRTSSGPHTFTCTATGGTGSGTIQYQWTSSSPTFQSSNSVITRQSVQLIDDGTHTCTATRGSDTGTATITINIVGAGIFVFVGSGVIGTQPNNGLVISNNPGRYFRFRFFCRSDNTTVGVGELLGLDGNPITDDSNFFGFEDSTIGGEFRIGNVIGSQTALPASEQGVYTCRIPLQSGVLREINIGVYPNGFSDLPTITNPLVFTPGSSSSTLTCTSTGSPATTVTFVRDGTTVGPLRDGESMTVDRVTYQLAQTVSNRQASTYENVLTITEERSSLAGSTFTCTVYNTLGGVNSQSFLIPAVLTVHITVTRTDPSGFTPGSDIEYRAASGPHTFTCTAEGGAGSGAYQYVWTSNSSTFSTAPPNGVIIRQAVHSGDIGTHTCTASRGGESGSANTVVTIADDELFQVQVGLVEHCVKWSSEKAKTVESSIQNAIIEVVEFHCKCKFPPSRIVSGQFSCRTTTTRVTYRSTIIGIVGYNASQLLDILQDWVDSGPIIKVDWLLLDVYAGCQVHISSLSVPECSTLETQPFGDPTLITSNPTVIQCVHVCLVRTEGHGICGV